MGRYLVTGGCGFIGSHLVKSLLDEGHKVRILDDLSTGAVPKPHKRLEIWIGDVADGPTVIRAMERVDGCFHLAAMVSPALVDRDWQKAGRTNISGSIAVLAAARAAQQGAHPRTVPVVYASSAAVYGEAGKLPLAEDAPCNPISNYGAAKLAVEVYASTVSQNYGIPTVGLRLFNVYGPNLVDAGLRSSYTGAVAQFFNLLTQGKPIRIDGNGEQTRDFVYVEDVIECFKKAMEQVATLDANPRVLNVCTETATSINEIARLIAGLCHQSPDIHFAPSLQGHIERSVGSQARMKRLLNMAPSTKLADGLTWTLRAMMNSTSVRRS